MRDVGDWLHLAACTRVHPTADATLQAMYPVRRDPSCPIEEMMTRQGFVEVADAETEWNGAIRDIARARGYRSLVAVPLLVSADRVGRIFVTRKEPGRFAPHDIQLLQTFADQALIAIENTRLFDETKEALERQTATAEILRAIASSTVRFQSTPREPPGRLILWRPYMTPRFAGSEIGSAEPRIGRSGRPMRVGLSACGSGRGSAQRSVR
jgi:GAF domain-containing protein